MCFTRRALIGLTGTVLCSFAACGSSTGAGVDNIGGDSIGSVDAGSQEEAELPLGPTVPADFQTIPYSLITAVDDIGWTSYTTNTVDPKTHKQLQPRNRYIDEDAKLSYYQDMADIGRRAGTRLGAVAVLQDWDYDSSIVIKSKYNGYDRLNDGTQSAHKMWMNPVRLPMSKALTEAIAKLMLDNAASVEFGMHGVAHEHYTDVHDTGVYDDAPEAQGGGFARAEFARLLNDDEIDPRNPTWGWDNGVKHMECFKEIYERFFPAKSHSFPKSFVAPAHGYYYNQDNPQDPTKTTSDLLRRYGIKYVDNDKRVTFSEAARSAQAKNPILRGVSFLDRGWGTDWSWHGEVPWYGNYTDTPYPRFPGSDYGAIEAHFPNLWDAVDAWVNYLKEVNHAPDRFLAKNTIQNHSQYYYNHQAILRTVNGVTSDDIAYEIDTRNISQEAYDSDVLGPLVLKTPLSGKHLSFASIDNDAQIIGAWEDDFGYGYLVIGSSNPMGRLSRGTFTLVARLGDTYMNDVVNFYGGTFNVLSRQRDAGGLKLVVEMYGTQDLHISRAKAPRSIVSSNPSALKINTTRFDAGTRELIVNLTATDIQGVTGVITIE
jgi:hypothetical protein